MGNCGVEWPLQIATYRKERKRKGRREEKLLSLSTQLLLRFSLINVDENPY